MPIKIEIVIEEERDGMRWKAQRSPVGEPTARERHQAMVLWHTLRMVTLSAGKHSGLAEIVETDGPHGNTPESRR